MLSLITTLSSTSVTCDYQIDMETSARICTRTSVLNNLNIDININSVDKTSSYSIVLNARRILNCNISVASSTQPKMFSLAQSTNTKEITDLSYKISFTNSNNNSIIHAISPISRQTIEISDILILFDFNKAQSVDIINTINGDLNLINSIIDCKQFITLQEFYLAETAYKLNCSWDQFNITIQSSSESSSFGLGKNINSANIEGSQYYGNMSQFEQCYLVAQTINSSMIIKDVKYGIIVQDKYHASHPAFTNSQITNITLNNGSGYINMSFVNWISGSSNPTYNTLSDFNQIKITNFISSNNQLNSILFNNSQVALEGQSQGTPQSNQIYGLTSSKTQFYNVTITGDLKLTSSNSYEISLLSTASTLNNLNAKYITFNVDVNNTGSNAKIQMLARQIILNQNYNNLSDITVNGKIISNNLYYGLANTIYFGETYNYYKIQNIKLIHSLVNVAPESSLFVYNLVQQTEDYYSIITFDNIIFQAPNITLEKEGNFSIFINNLSTYYSNFTNCNIQYTFTDTQYGNIIAFISQGKAYITKFQNNQMIINHNLQNLVKKATVFGNGINFNDQKQISNNTIDLYINYIPIKYSIIRHKFQYNQDAYCDDNQERKFYYNLVMNIEDIPMDVQVDGKIYKIQATFNSTTDMTGAIGEILAQDFIKKCYTQSSSASDNYVWGNSQHSDQEIYTYSSGISFRSQKGLIASDKYTEKLNVNAQCKYYGQSGSFTSCQAFSDADTTGKIRKTFQ